MSPPETGLERSMPIKSKRPYHHGDLRRAVLIAAERFLESNGPEGLSLREISRAIGVSDTAPRRHFVNKHALLEALAIEGFERLEAVLNRSAAGSETNFDTRIIKLTRAYARFAIKHSALLRLMYSVKHAPDASEELIEASQRALATAAVKVIRDGQTTGSVVSGDPMRLSLVIFSAVEGLIAISTDGYFAGQPLDKLVEDVVGQVIVGVRPRNR